MMKCLFLLSLCLLPFVVFSSSSFSSENPIELPVNDNPVPVFDVNGTEVDPRSRYRMVNTGRGPSDGDVYLDYTHDSTAPCPDGVFRYEYVGRKGTPVRLIPPGNFGPGIFENQEITIQFDIPNVNLCVDYTIWKAGKMDPAERLQFLETGDSNDQKDRCFKIVPSLRLFGYMLVTCDGSLVGTTIYYGTRLALMNNYSFDFNLEKVEE